MKNSKVYSKKIQALYRSLKREGPKVKKVSYDDPLDAVIYGILSEKMSESQSCAALKRFDNNFVDNNDLRISLADEVIEMLGVDNADTHQIAVSLSIALRNVFDRYNSVSLESLKKIGKRPAREAIEKIDGVSVFAADYCMLTAFDAHAIPLTEKIIEYLKSSNLVDPKADNKDITGFLTRQIPSKNAYEFYYLLRRKSESAKPKAKKKIKAKKKTAVQRKAKAVKSKAKKKVRRKKKG